MVTQECLDKIASKTCEIGENILARAKSNLRGGEPCCDTRAKDLRWYLASYLLNNYGNADAENPKKAYLNSANVECLCKWVDRQFALESQ
jgi:hypothetical protein